MTSKIPAIHGHRGARGLFPENSLVAIEAGIQSGCDAIEVDLCVSSDDQLVIHHDPVLSPVLVRDGDGRPVKPGLRLRELSLEKIRTLDIGSIAPNTDYSKRFRDQVSVPGSRIPTLDEFFKIAMYRAPEITLNLELKSTPYDLSSTPPTEEYAELLVSALMQHRTLIPRTFVQSFDWRLVLKTKHLLPDLKIGLLTDRQDDGDPCSPIPGKPDLWTAGYDLLDFEDIPEMVKQAGGDVWSSNALDVSPELVQSAHDKELEVYVWTVNSEKQMHSMIDWEVDAITTDYPDRLYRLLHGKPFQNTLSS